MKKALILALSATLLSAGAPAFADVIDDIAYETTMGKLDAAELQSIVETIRAQIQHLRGMQVSLENVGNTDGLLKALGETADLAQEHLISIDRTLDLQQAKQLKQELDVQTKELSPLVQKLSQ